MFKCPECSSELCVFRGKYVCSSEECVYCVKREVFDGEDPCREDTGLAASFFNRGMMLYNRGEYDKALESLSRAAELNSKDVDTQLLTGEILEKMGSYSDALGYYERVLETAPDNADGIKRKDELVRIMNDNAKSSARSERLYCFNETYMTAEEWEREKHSGQGTIYHDNGNVKYEGEFKDNNFDGMGKYYYRNGNIKYGGSFKEGKYSGEGILCYPHGSYKYRGMFKDGKFHGEGQLYSPDGVLECIGHFENNEYIGG